MRIPISFSSSRKVMTSLTLGILMTSVAFAETPKTKIVEGFGGVIAESYQDSKEWWPEEKRPPEGAPNVLFPFSLVRQIVTFFEAKRIYLKYPPTCRTLDAHVPMFESRFRVDNGLPCGNPKWQLLTADD